MSLMVIYGAQKELVHEVEGGEIFWYYLFKALMVPNIDTLLIKKQELTVFLKLYSNMTLSF